MANRFFGEPWDALFIDDAEQVATPVGEPCSYPCGELIADGDQGVVMACIVEGPEGKPIAELRPVHRECLIRATVGPVEHFIEGRCSGRHSDENWREQGRATIAWLEAHR